MKLYLILVCLFTLSMSVPAQVDKQSELYKTILSKDSLLFNVGFNTCDIRQFETLLSDQFEFFHDKDSISHKNAFIQALRKGLCQSPGSYQSRRELIPGTHEVYPLYKGKVLYGAIQSGSHRFYETLAGQKERFASSAKFTHVWLLENGTWKLARSLSYDHQSTKVSVAEGSFFDKDDEIEAWLSEHNVPVLGLGIIKDGQLQQINTFGELKKGLAAPYNTLFNVASLTKPVTAMVALKLISAGRWSLDAPIYKYWTDPDVAKDPRNKLLTTRHILSHQSGFANWRWANQDGKLRFEFSPGTKYHYSGEGYEYLRKALEAKFHKTLDQLAQELIFTPLHMTDTRYVWTQTTDSARFATGYDTKGNAYETVKRQKANAADDLLTTLEDYGRFLLSVMNAEGLSKQVAEEMVSRQVETKPGKYFGLGFEIYDLGNGEYALSHGGSDKGVHCIVFVLPKTKQGLLIFTNADEGYKVYEKIISHYLGSDGQKIIDIEMK